METTYKGNLLAVARLGAPRGLGGYLKVHSHSGEFGHLSILKEALLAPEGMPEQGKLYPVSGIQTGAWGMSISFSGYDSPEKARVLTGLEWYLPREKASVLGPSEYYINDLIGLRLVHEGKTVGKVRAVLEGGADPLLEIVRDGVVSSVLVPFRTIFVGEVDIGGGTIELLAGWLLE